MAGRGFIIRHKTERGVGEVSPIVTVAIASLPLNPPHDCPSCGGLHMVKTVHLELDANGFCIVSNGVLERLGEAGAIQLTTAGLIAGADPMFDFIGDMDDPTPITIGLGPVGANVPIERRRVHVDLS